MIRALALLDYVFAHFLWEVFGEMFLALKASDKRLVARKT
jgi:hypothetical protein